MVYFRSWNSEVFSAITGLIGAITGVFISQRTLIFFWREGFEMSPVSAKKLGNKSVRIQKPPINHPQVTFKISSQFTIKPAEEREKYVAILNEMIKQVQKITNSRKPQPSSN